MMKKVTLILILSVTLAAFAISPSWGEKSSAKSRTEEKTDMPIEQASAKKNKKGNAKMEATPEGDKYILFGKSVFDEEGGNVYRYGGRAVKYPVYINIDEVAGDASITNLIDVTGFNPVAAHGSYDAATHQIKIVAPIKNSRIGECQQIGSNGDEVIFLRAGNMYGAGYLDKVEDLLLNVSDDFTKLTPLSGIYASCAEKVEDEDEEEGYYWDVTANYFDAIYDAVILRQVAGVNFATSVDEISFEDTYVGETYTREFLLYNSGTDSSDYVVTSSDDSFTLLDDSGELESESFKTITVQFLPKASGSYEATLLIQSEGNEVEVRMTANVASPIDYSEIVEAGDFQFASSSEYPWKIQEMNGYKVAISSNAGVGNSESILTATFSVDEGNVGKLSWSGICDPRVDSYDEFSAVCDGKTVVITKAAGSDNSRNMDISGSVMLSPGEHTMVFMYDKGLAVNITDFDYGDDFAYIYGLKLEQQEGVEAQPVVSDSEVALGKVYIDAMEPSVTKEIELSNQGYGNLEIQEIVASAPFSATAESMVLASQESTKITIVASPTSVGEYSGEITIKTNGGNVTVSCSVEAIKMPDFSSIVSQGTFYFDTDPNCPFTVENGVAYNANSEQADDEESMAYLMAYFYVPTGKIGKIWWNATVDTQSLSSSADVAFVMVGESLNTFYGQRDAGPTAFYPYQVMNLTEGWYWVVFGYNRNGDGMTYGQDRISVSDLSLTLSNALPSQEVTLWRNNDIVDLGSANIDEYTYEKINFANTGLNSLQITSVDAEEGFECVVDTEDIVTSMSYSSFYVKFVPTEPREYNGKVVVHTTSGDLELNCSGVGVAPESHLLYEDFEDELEGWTFQTKGETYSESWTRGTDGQYAHEGNGYLFSSSLTWTDDNVNNYAISPEIEVPEGGATLTFWVGESYTYDGLNESYEVYWGNADDLDSAIFLESNTLEDEGYIQRTISLNDFVGQKGSIIFRHCSEDWIDYLLIDDVVVDANLSEVETVLDATEVVSVEYFNINGIRVSESTEGILLKRTIYANGYAKVEKVINK